MYCVIRDLDYGIEVKLVYGIGTTVYVFCSACFAQNILTSAYNNRFPLATFTKMYLLPNFHTLELEFFVASNNFSWFHLRLTLNNFDFLWI